MEPVISPIWIYLIHAAYVIHGLSIFALVASTFALMLGWSLGWLTDGIKFDDSDSSKLIKVCVTTIIVSIILLVLIPDKNTMYVMLAASVITPDNISSVEGHVADLITNIISAVNNAK